MGQQTIEQAHIATLVTNPSHLALVDLLDEDFAHVSNREIFATMRKMAEKGETWDFSILYYRLGGLGSYLNSITGDLNGPPALIPAWVREIKRLKSERLINDLIQSGINDPLELADAIQSKVAKLADARTRNMKQLSLEAMDHMEKASKHCGSPSGVPSGFKSLDDFTWGFQPQRLYLLAGRPSMGKSMLSMNFAYNAAAKGKRVYIQALEESSSSLMARFIAHESKLNNEDLNKGRIAEGDWNTIATSIGKLSEMPVMIDDSSGLKSAEICNRIKKEHISKPLDLVIIDHIQQIWDEGESRHLQISKAASNFKELAKSLKIPVIAVCQLNRGTEKREDKKPQMSDLKESGDLEQVADVIFLLWREGYYNTSVEDKSHIELGIAKNRDGRIGVVNLTWRPEIATFYDYGNGL